jgi:phospholipid/cholesterol/gamma-HCH transport system permease protein
MTFTDSVGHRVVSYLRYSGELFLLFYWTMKTACLQKKQGLRSVISVLSSQVYFTGVQALPLISIIAFLTGSVIVIQGVGGFSFIDNSGDFLGKLMVMVSVREAGPLLTALIVIARSGTAVASELGNLRVNKEIEALELMGINPYSYVVFPRLFGGVISVLCLAFYFIFIAIVGGYFAAAVFKNMPLQYYFSIIARAFSGSDLMLFVIKNISSGVIIFSVCSYQGLSVKQSPHEVPQVTTKAVMDSIFYILIVHFIITGFYYLNDLMALGVL